MGKMSAQEKKWRTEDDLRILAQAEEIQKDPERMKACRALAKQRMAEMEKLAGAGAVKQKK